MVEQDQKQVLGENYKRNVYLGGKIGDKFLLNASYSGNSSKDYRDRSPQYENKKDKRDSLWLRENIYQIMEVQQLIIIIVKIKITIQVL